MPEKKLIIFDFDGVLIHTTLLPQKLHRSIPEEMKILVRKLATNYLLAIVSASEYSAISDILETQDVRIHFTGILGGNANGEKAVKIAQLLKEYGITPQNAVMITDTTSDVREARGCGVQSIAVTWGFHDRLRLEHAEPEYYVDTVQELEQAIENYFSQ